MVFFTTKPNDTEKPRRESHSTSGSGSTRYTRYTRSDASRVSTNTSSASSILPPEDEAQPQPQNYDFCYMTPSDDEETCGSIHTKYRAPCLSTSIHSLSTYASTLPSAEDVVHGVESYRVPQEPPEQVCETDVIASTSQDFKALFPSSRTLYIEHDDATSDGNMNLRVDAPVVTEDGRDLRMTLYHLRMQDLKDRVFSLRRHCRDSGREICRSHRSAPKLTSDRSSSLQRLSSVFASFRSGVDIAPPTSPSSRIQSVYSTGCDDDDDLVAPLPYQTPTSDAQVSLEFSNYAHIDVKRRPGFRSNSRYDFEYWGHTYTWSRVPSTSGKPSSYHLSVDGNSRIAARITPVPLTPAEAQTESEQGGWVPPCSLQMLDDALINGSTDVADVVVATGLIALVDSSIRSHFHSKERRHLLLPLANVSPLARNLDFVHPKRLIDEAFGRCRQRPVPNWR